MKICEWCGEEIPEEEIKASTQKYHKECREKSRKERVKEKRKKAWENKTLICEWCGKEITWEEYRMGGQKYHKECAPAAGKVKSALWEQKKRGDRPPRLCAWCEKEIPPEEGKYRKYHKKCKPWVIKEQIKKQTEKRKTLANKKWATSSQSICRYCGKRIEKHSSESNRRRYHRECYIKKYEKKTDKSIEPRYIYFIRSTTSLIKIGKTKNIKNRVNSLQSMSPVQLTVLYVFHGPEYEERRLHKKFEHLKSNISPLHTEWFHDSLEIHEEIESLKKQYGQVKIKLNAHADQ